jgi:hypothetical protein
VWRRGDKQEIPNGTAKKTTTPVATPKNQEVILVTSKDQGSTPNASGIKKPRVFNVESHRQKCFLVFGIRE